MAAVTLACSAGVAAANVVDLPGNYGNETGCSYLLDGGFDDDTHVALTPEKYESYATGCEFVQSARSKDGDHVVTMLCSHEGETFKSIDFMRIVKADGRDAYEMYNRAGDPIATVDRCK